MGKPAWYVTGHIGQLNLQGRKIKYQPVWLDGLKVGCVVYLCQVTLGDAIRQVTSRSCEMEFH